MPLGQTTHRSTHLFPSLRTTHVLHLVAFYRGALGEQDRLRQSCGRRRAQLLAHNAQVPAVAARRCFVRVRRRAQATAGDYQFAQ